ncbi:MAG: hypothetical protein P8X67_07695, partial [Syntrophobacterales bacterium]
AGSPTSTLNPATMWASFNWEDPFRLEQQLTDDERLVMDTARQYAQEQLAPRVQEAYHFEGIKWGKQVDVFSGSKHESSAAEFDTFGVTFAGVKK